MKRLRRAVPALLHLPGVLTVVVYYVKWGWRDALCILGVLVAAYGFATILVFFMRRREQKFFDELREDAAPYLQAAERGEWPYVPRPATPPPPPDDEGPQAA